MIKKTYLLILILSVSFILGCSNVSSKNKSTTVDYHKGTQGIVMKFSTNAPPAKVYKGSGIDIILDYSNKGAYKIYGGKIYISGYDTTYIPYLTDNGVLNNLEAEGKSIFNPLGDYINSVTFSSGQVIIPSSVDRMTQIIKATACYNYMTEASAEVCIDPQTTKTLKESVCSIHNVGFTGGQGAPIAVTNVEEEAYQNKVQFKIYFENVGGGTVYLFNKINNCHTSLTREDINKVEVYEVLLSGSPLRCQPDNPIRLNDKGQGLLYCTAENIPISDAYNTVLQIKLRYGYRNSIQTKVEILQEP